MKINIRNLAATISTALLSFAVTYLMNTGQPVLITILLVIVVAGFGIFFLFEVLPALLLKAIPRLQQFGRFEMRIHGIWIQRFSSNEDRIYSYAYITYDPYLDSLSYSGFAYDKDGNRKGEWKSRDVICNPKDLGVFYSYEGEVYDSTEYAIQGLGSLRFGAVRWGNYQIGTGTVMESVSKFSKHFFQTDRISETLCNELIKKPCPETNDDIRNLIQAYHNLQSATGNPS